MPATATPEYAKPPEEIDMQRAERAIRIAGLIALVGFGLAAWLGYVTLPKLVAFPTGLAERLAFAAQASILVLAWVLIGVGMVSTGRRRSAADSGGSAARPPSEHIAIPVAFLQNTLEQAVLAVGVYFAVASLLAGPWLSLIIVAAVFFGVGRVLFLRGYAKGAAGRAQGMTLTMMPTMLGYVLAIVLIIARWF